MATFPSGSTGTGPPSSLASPRHDCFDLAGLSCHFSIPDGKILLLDIPPGTRPTCETEVEVLKRNGGFPTSPVLSL